MASLAVRLINRGTESTSTHVSNHGSSTSSPRYLGSPYRTLFFLPAPKIPHRWKQPSLSSHTYGVLYLSTYILRYQLRDVGDTVSPAKIKGHGVTKVIVRQGLINVIIFHYHSITIHLFIGFGCLPGKKKGEKIQKPKSRYRTLY